MPKPRNLVLTGFMGTGKTTVGRIVADRIGFVFVDSDEIIEQEYGPISTIFDEQGESGFRQIERTVARRLAGRKGQVVATGGGMVLDSQSRNLLTRGSLIICLTASPEEIHRRIAGESAAKDRPMLTSDNPADRIRRLLVERDMVYSQFDQVSTDERDPDEVANAVVDLWQRSV